VGWRLSRARFLIAALVLAAVLVYLGYVGFRGGATYYWTVAEVQARRATLVGQPLRVSGQVAPGSIQRGPLQVSFTLEEGGASLPVVYRGVVPDLFQGDINAVVEGKLSPEGTFQAETLLVKCPSKWEAANKEAG